MVDSMHPIWYNTGMPIMTMDDIGRPIQGTHASRIARQNKNKTFAIISIAIDIFALKKARGIDHIDGNGVANVLAAH